MTDNSPIPGALMIYHHYLKENAPTIMEHVHSFSNYSRYKFWSINTEYGFPKYLNKINFSVIILHYSLFGVWPIKVVGKFSDYLQSTPHIPKIAFFQDDYTACMERFRFIDEFGIDSVYTLLDPKHHHRVYYSNTNCKSVKHTLAGYVDDTLIEIAKRITIPDNKRTIDIGYRARPLPYYLGKGGQEKTMIAAEFDQRINSSDLNIDIKTAEKDRIYGQAWHYFIANCRAMIGVEAGSTIVDLESNIRPACEQYLQENPDATFEEVFSSILLPHEGNINYRVVSPRIFECAAFRVCMILFEGQYSNILKPMIHYIPLKKDFSNFDQVMKLFNDTQERKKLTENAYNDLIASGKYSYQNFILEFDNQLKQFGIEWNIKDSEVKWVDRCLNRDLLLRTLIVKSKPFLKTIKKIIKMIIKPKKTIRRFNNGYYSKN